MIEMMKADIGEHYQASLYQHTGNYFVKIVDGFSDDHVLLEIEDARILKKFINSCEGMIE